MTQSTPTTSTSVRSIVVAFELARMRRELERRRQRMEELFTTASVAAPTSSPATSAFSSSPASFTTPSSSTAAASAFIAATTPESTSTTPSTPSTLTTASAPTLSTPTDVDTTMLRSTTKLTTTTADPVRTLPTRCSTLSRILDECTLAPRTVMSAPLLSSLRTLSAPTSLLPATAAAPKTTPAHTVLDAEKDVFASEPTRCSIYYLNHDMGLLQPLNSSKGCSFEYNRYINNSTTAHSVGTLQTYPASKAPVAQNKLDEIVRLNSILLQPLLVTIVDRGPEPYILKFERVCILPKPPGSIVCFAVVQFWLQFNFGWVTWHQKPQWPPPVQWEMQTDGVHLRPMAWPPFGYPRILMQLETLLPFQFSFSKSTYMMSYFEMSGQYTVEYIVDNSFLMGYTASYVFDRGRNRSEFTMAIILHGTLQSTHISFSLVEANSIALQFGMQVNDVLVKWEASLSMMLIHLASKYSELMYNALQVIRFIRNIPVGSVQSFWGDLLYAWVIFPLHLLTVRQTALLRPICAQKLWPLLPDRSTVLFSALQHVAFCNGLAGATMPFSRQVLLRCDPEHVILSWWTFSGVSDTLQHIMTSWFNGECYSSELCESFGSSFVHVNSPELQPWSIVESVGASIQSLTGRYGSQLVHLSEPGSDVDQWAGQRAYLQPEAEADNWSYVELALAKLAKYFAQLKRSGSITLKCHIFTNGIQIKLFQDVAATISRTLRLPILLACCEHAAAADAYTSLLPLLEEHTPRCELSTYGNYGQTKVPPILQLSAIIWLATITSHQQILWNSSNAQCFFNELGALDCLRDLTVRQISLLLWLTCTMFVEPTEVRPAVSVECYTDDSEAQQVEMHHHVLLGGQTPLKFILQPEERRQGNEMYHILGLHHKTIMKINYKGQSIWVLQFYSQAIEDP